MEVYKTTVDIDASFKPYLDLLPYGYRRRILNSAIGIAVRLCVKPFEGRLVVCHTSLGLLADAGLQEEKEDIVASVMRLFLATYTYPQLQEILTAVAKERFIDEKAN